MANFALDRTELQKLCANMETIFNWCGYFSPHAAGLRSGYASLQIIGGIFLAGMKAANASMTSDEEARSAAFKDSYRDLIFVVHGGLNKARSIVEGQLFFPLSLATAVWDLAGMRIKYKVERDAAGQSVTMDMVVKNITWLRSQVNRFVVAADMVGSVAGNA